ncbi:tRNA (adenosine(37)-N6)-dimethylallyltransferase MiaA [Geomonas sp. RF6]|uniref:tRNA (adenosine(37)-N6)-dimethylallyltransferase MiaA n=1 Tax=Geomonas sp. RF6 TaxID=2897342 RepID=UPI001E37F66B|nr:tRNA (adenosine(37)-N6)-dimethylallyltransferase MiaA [Geomonas sp. RF6]UFS69048.1 tRNA (adenosine(37)-N6)-dimethylallyltransferase MiaA [Geomonas sp. RF6]
MTSKKTKIIVVAGPTGSGKSALALQLAERIGGEIVNADSMQLYRGMDIGTSKPAPEELERVPHHLFSIVSPDTNFSASDYRREAAAAISDIESRGRTPIVVGGTGLYIKALLHGLVDSPTGDPELRLAFQDLSGDELLERLREVDPETAARLHPNDRVRLVRALEVYSQTGRAISDFRAEHAFADTEYEALKLAPKVERAALYNRIEDRVDRMMEGGLLAEVASLMERGYGVEHKAMRAIGYKELCAHLAGEISLPEAVALIKRDTRRYAKRQLTWFTRDNEIYWLEYPESFATIVKIVIEFLA